MPRLNHGTLLENLVVLEVTRVLTEDSEATVEFACSFAMPPLTQCWHRSEYEAGLNPKFNVSVLTSLLNGNFTIGAFTSYSVLLRDCIANTPQLPVQPYAKPDEAYDLCNFGGPNGALLAALLTRRQGQSIRIWSNDLIDDQTRYRVDANLNASSECPRTSTYAASLSPGSGEAPEMDTFSSNEFPNSVPDMARWCRKCSVRIGFLDPDSYVGDRNAKQSQVNRDAHLYWLTGLHCGAEVTAGIMFFASQNADGRPELIAAFHNDAAIDYSQSVVFCHGNYMVGVKLRSHEAGHRQRIIDSVQQAWAFWSNAVGRDANGLRWDLN